MSSDPQFSSEKFEWQLNTKIIVSSLLLFPVLLALGFWQLDRAEQKRDIVNDFIANQQAAPLRARQLVQGRNYQYRSAILRGSLDGTRRIFLDNRVKYGRPGYEVLEALLIDALGRNGQQQRILVNRGWVPASLDRLQLPTIESVDVEAVFRGSLYRQLRGGYRLDDGIKKVTQWPSRVGWISAERSSTLFDEPFYDYQLRLDADSVGALDTGWPTVSVQPQKHTGYAVQWFAMAVVLLIMTLTANSNIVYWLKSKYQARA
ncbi:MAG: SURF1 family protein [Porticoccaceae bacterium]|nr:SURF1 family protein [Porticoccaceae bacterium]MDG1474365.1 SURF1 family protein [Porticoccaceae bacterium]